MTNFDEIVRNKRVIVCVGSGGVGKTTTSAVIGLHAALAGRKVLVMTIDPARRLANSLGLNELNEEIQQIEIDGLGETDGELWATMLDMKHAFDEIVERYTATEAEKQSLLENRFYEYFSTSLAGAQELSASEKLYHLYETGEYDLIVLDTPPTTNALDFLDAPVRFFEAIDGAAFQWMINAGKNASRRRGGIVGIGTGFIVKSIGRFTGTQFIEDLVEFLRHFSALFGGLQEHTQATTQLFSDTDTSFVIVTSPDPTTVDEAGYFRSKLKKYDVTLGGLVVNRVRQVFSESDLAQGTINELADALEAVEGADLMGRTTLTQLARKLLANVHEWDQLAHRDAEMIGGLRSRIRDDVPISEVPMYASDVHTLDGLDQVRRDLFKNTSA